MHVRDSSEDPQIIPHFLKQISFWILTIAFPVLFLVTGEFLLRFFDYGGNLNLVTTKLIQGKEYYTLNRTVARRYFSQPGIAPPEVHDDLFEVDKQSNTKRIFMLGESTMAGYPFDYNATAPSLLRDRLSQALPQFNFEVVNAGLAAINSYTVLEFTKELMQYQPDAFIVYAGHNEFYGALGVGSTEYLGQSRWIVNQYLRLQNFRLFRLLRNLFISARNIFREDPKPNQSTLMEAMVKEKQIQYGDTKYRLARAHFEENLREIVRVARDHGVPIIFSTLISNLRDQKPLRPAFRENISDSVKVMWHHSFDQGISERKVNKIPDAVESFQHAILIDSLQADAHFALAQCLEELGTFKEAKYEYEKAKDYDCLRFRATKDFNSVILQMGEERGVWIADATSWFEETSPHGIVGNNLMLDHLHPTFEGYFLLAKCFFDALKERNLLLSADAWKQARATSDTALVTYSSVTDFDREVANYRIFELTNGWPFQSPRSPATQYEPTSRTQELAIAYVNKKIAWSQARYDLATWYTAKGSYNLAAREYYAVAKVIPYYYLPSIRMGDMYRLMNQDSLAEIHYRHALSLQNSPFVHVRLGMLYFDLGKIDKSIDHFEKTLAIDQSGTERLDTKGRSSARYLLGVAYGKRGDIRKAEENLRLALNVDPMNSEARELLARMQKGGKKFPR